MKKRPDITDATRQRFVDTFCRLYEIKPIEKITVKEIAEKAGHNRVTFYQYFHDAYEILEYLENRFLENAKIAIEKNIRSGDMFTQFEKIFDGIIEDDPEMVKLLLRGANCSSTLERCKAAIVPVITEVLAVDDEDYRAKAVLEFYISGVASLLKYKVDHDDKIATVELGNIIKHMLQNGVITQLSTKSGL